jgi:2-oxoglutarate ferredoxin oxidoreductase subunit delta
MTAKKGRIEIRKDRCKGCRLCLPACPRGSIKISAELNEMGYHPAEFSGTECTACGLCYTACPEPGCITVFLLEEGEE